MKGGFTEVALDSINYVFLKWHISLSLHSTLSLWCSLRFTSCVFNEDSDAGTWVTHIRMHMWMRPIEWQWRFTSTQISWIRQKKYLSNGISIKKASQNNKIDFYCSQYFFLFCFCFDAIRWGHFEIGTKFPLMIHQKDFQNDDRNCSTRYASSQWNSPAKKNKMYQFHLLCSKSFWWTLKKSNQ
jgi:hypothetical protein